MSRNKTGLSFTLVSGENLNYACKYCAWHFCRTCLRFKHQKSTFSTTPPNLLRSLDKVIIMNIKDNQLILAFTIYFRNEREEQLICVCMMEVWGGFIPLKITYIWFVSKGSKCQDLSKRYPITLLALTSKLGWKYRVPPRHLFSFFLKAKSAKNNINKLY